MSNAIRLIVAVAVPLALEGFPLPMVVVDMIWGMALCTGVSGITYLAATRIV